MMEQLVADLTKIMPFKDTTVAGDLVLVACENPVVVNYALVRSIERDTSRKDEWWHVEMQLLALPPQKVTWTLRTPQFTGGEIFTMGGDGRFIKAVDFDTEPPPADEQARKTQERNSVSSEKKGSLRLVK